MMLKKVFSKGDCMFRPKFDAAIDDDGETRHIKAKISLFIGNS